ncbi:recombinase RecT [Streptomyces sp. NPDC003877]
MSTEIVKHQPAAPVAHRGGALSLGAMTPHDAWKFAEALAGARLLPQEYQNNPGSVLWAMEYGRALGLDVVTTITTIHVIKGKPTQSADLMLSRAREAGHRVRIKSERERCVVSIVRHDDPEDENVVEWTLADARTAGLFPGKPDSNWAKYPRAMLRARAIAECVRIACPEVLHGAIYTAEELGARVDDAGLPVDAEVQQLRRVEPGQTDQWSTPAPQQGTSPEQEFADTAATETNRAKVQEIYRKANAAGLLGATVKVGEETQELGAYLIARGQQLAAPAPSGDEKQGSDEVTDVEVVAEGETEADIAERELRAAATAAGLDNLDEEFEQSYGIPIAQAGAQQLRQMTAILTGSAA